MHAFAIKHRTNRFPTCAEKKKRIQKKKNHQKKTAPGTTAVRDFLGRRAKHCGSAARAPTQPRGQRARRHITRIFMAPLRAFASHFGPTRYYYFYFIRVRYTL